MSLLFGGVASDRIDYGSPAVLDDLHASTFSGWGWVMRTSNGTNQYIMSKDGAGLTGWALFVVNTAAEGTLSFYAQRNTTTTQFTSDVSNVLPLNTWCMVGFSYDPNATPRAHLYIGTLTSTIAEVSGYSTTTAGSGTPKTDAANNFWVGNLPRTTSLPFKGRIARAGLATGILTAADFARIQWAPAPVLPPGTVWATEIWAVSTSNFDLTGAGNGGTVTGTALADHVPLPAPWAVMIGDPPHGGSLVTDTTPPVFAGASVAANGLSVAVSLTDAGSILPTSGVTGFSVTVGGSAATISSATASGTTVTLTLSSAVYISQTVTVAYTPGNVTDNASNAMLAFAAQSVTNNSTVTNDIAPNNASIVYPVSDLWLTSSTYARCAHAGNTMVFAVTVAANEPVALTFNTTRYTTAGAAGANAAAGTTPTILVEMDGTALDPNGDATNYVQLSRSATSQKVTLVAAPTNGRHVFRLWFRSIEEASGSALGQWGSGGSIPPVTLELTSINLGATSAIASLTAGTDYRTRKVLVFGDSQMNGVLANLEAGNSSTATNPVNNNLRQSWQTLLFYDRLGYEVGCIAKGGIGYQTQSGTFQASATANPPMYGASGAGTGELFATYRYNGLAFSFSQSYSIVLVELGPNDGGSLTQAMVSGLINKMRAVCGATPYVVDLLGPRRDGASTHAAAMASPADSKIKYIDTGIQLVNSSPDVNGYSSDGSHMNHQGQIAWANYVYAGLVTAGVVTPASGGRRRGRFGLAILARLGLV